MVPEYLPIDENHLCLPTETYGLSKVLGEEICQMFHRAYGIEIIALRYCWVWFPEQIDDIRSAIRMARKGSLGQPDQPAEFNPGT